MWEHLPGCPPRFCPQEFQLFLARKTLVLSALGDPREDPKQKRLAVRNLGKILAWTHVSALILGQWVLLGALSAQRGLPLNEALLEVTRAEVRMDVLATLDRARVL